MYKGFSGCVLFLGLIFQSLSVHAQTDSQDQLFQKYQAMVIIEEANQQCPILSRLEAEVLNGQIVFADQNFAGNLEPVEKFKKEARIFARRANCNSPEISGLIGLARQEANDAMVNHLLLARQIHILDDQDKKNGTVVNGLLLEFLSDDEWSLIDDFYEEVKNNYLTNADEDAWDAYIDSIENVAKDRNSLTYIKNETILKTMPNDSFQYVQAMANNKEINVYYHNLEKSVVAFIQGGNASKTGYPYSRPANDFTNWTAYRPREENVNWALSYYGCGGSWDNIDCVLFTTADDEMGIVISGGDIDKIMISYRNPDDSDALRELKIIESPIGSNQANIENMKANIELVKNKDSSRLFDAVLSNNHNKFKAQTGAKVNLGDKVYIFPKNTLGEIDRLSKNDMLSIIIKYSSDNNKEETGMIPIHNYHRAKNWAYTTQF